MAELYGKTNFNGSGFRCLIDDVQVEGKVSVYKGEVYLCQDKFEGGYINERFGYKYSYYIGEGSELDMAFTGVSNFKWI